MEIQKIINTIFYILTIIITLNYIRKWNYNNNTYLNYNNSNSNNINTNNNKEYEYLNKKQLAEQFSNDTITLDKIKR
jgi:PBP1b-binding outer membrane lipoprotein LpoB